MLHNNTELFEQVVLQSSEFFGINEAIVEKDYFVSVFLKEISLLMPEIIFKGGTSLSKCYKVINRFSEDIDLNIETDARPTEGQRKALKRNIVSVIDKLNLSLTNPDDVKSRRDYNKYIVDFPSVFDYSGLKQHLIVETSVYLRAFPNNKMEATSIIYDYLIQNGFEDIAERYSLHPFTVTVQSAERTFIDKIFALGDYYLDGKIQEHSRHIYDLYKLSPIIKWDTLNDLYTIVLADRRQHKACSSAQEGVDMKVLLKKIVNEKAYKEDYENITESLLFEELKYDEAIKSVESIIQSDIFNA